MREEDKDILHANQLRGFVELGFSSATPSESVALQYAGRCGAACERDSDGYCKTHLSTLLEIETGHIDRGASPGCASMSSFM